MIANEKELEVTQRRIVQFQQRLATLRHTARQAEFAAVASGYRIDIGPMQATVLDYLIRPLPGVSEGQHP